MGTPLPAGARTLRAPSLRRRLLTWLTLLHLLAMAAAAWASYSLYGRVIEGLRDEQMRTLAQPYQGQAHLLGLPAVAPDAALLKGALVVQVWAADGQQLLATSMDTGVPFSATPGFSDAVAQEPPHERWRVYTAPRDAAEGAYRVQVLQSERFRQQRSLQRALIEGLPIALLLPAALALLWAIVWSASRSLRTVADGIAAQDEHGVDATLPQRVPEEIVPLMQAYNALLARLREALAAQRRFVQDAAHELRTPLTAMALQVDNLRAHMPAGPAQERFALLEAGMARTRHLLDQLLTLSRQEAGAALAPTVAVPLLPLLQEAMAQFADRADARQVDLGFWADPALAGLSVQGRAPELRSLFDNLIDNALRHTPPGSVVDVRLLAGETGPVVEVVDNGPGIEAQLLGRVFDRFFRAPDAPTGGSGLGLAIALAVARRHGLRLTLRNRRTEEGGPGLVASVGL